MKAITRITFFSDEGEKFFGEGPWRLLRLVEEKGSLRSAAMSMDMAYTKALKLLKNAEAALGFPLTTRTTGGRSGGGSALTPEAQQWLKRYEAYRDACVQANQQLFRQMFPRIGCVIMASGMGRRFGGNKLMADFAGEPMICRALSATEGLFASRVVVTRHEDVASLCRERGLSVVLHDLPDRSDTIRLGLDALGDVDACLFCPGDQPLLSRSTVAALCECFRNNREKIVRPVFAGTPGAPVLFPAWAFAELSALPRGKGGQYVISCHPEAVAEVPVSDPDELTDADTPQALEHLRAISGK